MYSFIGMLLAGLWVFDAHWFAEKRRELEQNRGLRLGAAWTGYGIMVRFCAGLWGLVRFFRPDYFLVHSQLHR